MKLDWRLWAVAQGLAKTLSAIFQKLVGVVMGTLEMGCVAAALIGMVQTAVGLVGWATKSKQDPQALLKLVPDVRSVLCLVLIVWNRKDIIHVGFDTRKFIDFVILAQPEERSIIFALRRDVVHIKVWESVCHRLLWLLSRRCSRRFELDNVD